MGICKKLREVGCLVAAVSVSLFLISGTAPAQDAQQCACLLPAAGAGVPVGEIKAVDGDVMMSQPAGYSAPLKGMPIALGSRIVVGANSSASLLFGGNCPVEMSAGTIAKIDPSQAGVCVSVDRPVVAEPVVEEVTAPESSNGLLLGVLTAAAVGGGVALVISTDDGDEVSD